MGRLSDPEMKRHYSRRYNPKPFHNNVVRILSKRGICSRKQALQWVQEGRVTVNGRTILDPGLQVDLQDRILIDRKSPARKAKRCLLLHKPSGYITTRQDERGRKTVYDLLPEDWDPNDWIFPVGRLDRDSEGLLVFTNDTDLGDRLTDPKHRVPRTYKVWLAGELSNAEVGRVCGGMEIGRGERSGAAEIKVLNRTSTATYLQIILTEGKNREIRRIFEILGKPVERLLRTRFGPFALGNLEPGEWREVAIPGY